MTGSATRAINLLQSVIAVLAIVSVTYAVSAGKIGSDAYVAVLSGILGYVFGSASTITAANGVAQRVEQAASNAIEAGRQTPAG